jgi:hypothetical protein
MHYFRVENYISNTGPSKTLAHFGRLEQEADIGKTRHQEKLKQPRFPKA